jgi:molecular chaperone DnaK (HSP70)
MDYLIKQYKNKTGTDVSKNLHALGKLKRKVEKAKQTLSSQQSTRIEIESFEDGNDFSETLTRAKFEELNVDLFRKSMKPVEQVLKDANIKKDAISEVVLVVAPLVFPKFNNSSKSISVTRSPPREVAYGAAVQGSILAGAEENLGMVLVDVYPLTLGIATTGGVFTKLIPRNTVIPTRKSQIFSTAADNQPTVMAKVASKSGTHSSLKGLAGFAALVNNASLSAAKAETSRGLRSGSSSSRFRASVGSKSKEEKMVSTSTGGRTNLHSHEPTVNHRPLNFLLPRTHPFHSWSPAPSYSLMGHTISPQRSLSFVLRSTSTFQLCTTRFRPGLPRKWCMVCSMYL